MTEGSFHPQHLPASSRPLDRSTGPSVVSTEALAVRRPARTSVVTAHQPSAQPGSRRAALVALVAIAVVWGITFSVVKGVLGSVSPASLVTWRFSIATVTLLALRPRCLLGLPSATWGRAAALGVILGAGFLTHTLGLQLTSVVSSAFITGMVVVFAPLVARLWLGRSMTRGTSAAVGLATAGLAVITLRPTAVSAADLLVVGAAALWAVHLVGLEVWTRPRDVYPVAVIQLGVVSLLAALVQLVTGGRITVPAEQLTVLALVGLGSVATAAAFVLLTWTQTRVDATTAAVILTLEPVFGALTAVSLGEQLSVPLAAGAIGVLLGAVLVVRRPADPC
jgi:drug/metabolite transporter (DMT)-like permease